MKVIISEQVEDIFYRTRLKGKYPTTVSFSLGYANGGGLRKQFTNKNGFKATTIIIEKLWSYISQNADPLELIRVCAVNFTNFKDSSIQQLELFKSNKEIKSEAIDYAMDHVRLKYGKNSVMRASSLTKSGTQLSRSKTIAGHHI